VGVDDVEPLVAGNLGGERRVTLDLGEHVAGVVRTAVRARADEAGRGGVGRRAGDRRH
jgi:hypothetical protein